MKMISYFLLLFYVLFFIVTFIVTSNGKRLTYASAKANANFVNITVNSVTPISVQLGQKQIRCLKSCLDNASCMSFFYNFLSSECRHFGVDFTDPGVGVPENGWKYYTVVRDCRINGYACPTSTGYTFFADICLCYKYVAIKSTHWQAKQYCANIKGYLIKINRKLKQREMERLLATVPDPQQPNGDIFIQGTRVGNTTKWRYDDGQEMTYFQWNKGIASLPVLDSKQENGNIFIQGTRVGNTSKWRYDDGQEITYFQWNKGKSQPQLSTGENVIAMQKVWGSLWHDATAASKIMFVCEVLL